MSQGDSPPRPPTPPVLSADCVSSFNNAEELDFRTYYADITRDENDDVDPFLNININSKYYDMYSLPSILNDSTSPIYFSVNIQSLNSKFKELKLQILDL
jgi:hypothetical protein